MSDSEASLSALARARERARERGEAVLDVLQTTMSAEEIDALAARTGVLLLQSEPGGVLRRERGDGTPGAIWILATSAGRECILMSDPWDNARVGSVQRLLGRYVEPVAAGAAVLRELLARPDGPGSPMPDRRETPPGLQASADAVGFVDSAIAAALRDGASDIHFECDREGVVTKLRLDGVMSPLARMAGRQRADEVISRIKVLAQLDITERRLPQDGRFRHESGGHGIDLRVSIMPSVFGEDAVLRLLDKSHLRKPGEPIDLIGLGFGEADVRRLRELITLPSGMILVTGPTGSGKTTTVYAALSEINTGREKTITIEDPVEYELPGVLQIPVNERKGLTFARGLRSILRHDPDRILVGEIRDAETAAIAVQSALTGHLVFSTVHANSLIDVLGRFRHFGIDMFGFVSSLNGVVVQRLLRRVCASCATRRPPSSEERSWLERHRWRDGSAVPQAVGCDRCRASGYSGRFVLAEIHTVSDRLRDLVMRHADLSELKAVVFEDGEGPRPLLHAALQQVRSGRTTLEEVRRVVGHA